MNDLVRIFEEHPVAVAVAAVSAVVLLVLAAAAARRLGRALTRVRKRVSDDNLLTYLSASIATGVSAQGMWPFFRETVGLPVWLTVGFFAFIELMVLANAVRARKSMKENFSAGVDGVAMWVLTCLSAVLSATHAESFGEVLFRLSAPLVAAWGWERSMKLERRRRTGATGINWRLTPERVLTRLGLADPTDRTAAQVDAHRRILRLAIAAKRARTVSGKKRGRALGRLDKAMEGAVEYGRLGTDPDSRDALMATLGALVNASDLLELRPVAPWRERTAPAEVSDAGQPRVHNLDASVVSARADGMTYAALMEAFEITKYRVEKALKPSGSDTETTTPDSVPDVLESLAAVEDPKPSIHAANGHTYAAMGGQ